MTRLAEFVLRHRLLVVLFWVVMVPIGGFAAGQTSDRLTLDFSLPGQPGYETEKQILATYGNGGSNPPTIAVVTVPEGTTVDEQLVQDHSGVRRRSRRPCRKTRFVDYAETEGPGLPHRRQAHDLRARLPRGVQELHRRRARRRDEADPGEGQQGHRLRLRRHGLQPARAGHRRPRGAEPARRDAARRARCARRAGVPVRLVPRAGAAAHRGRLDPDDVHHRAARHLRVRHQLRRAVPHRPGRPRRRDRLLPAGGQPMARGTGARSRQPRRRRHRDELRRPRRRGQRRHRRDQPVRAAGHPGAAAAQHGHRRHAHPARQHAGRPDPAAGAAGQASAPRSTGRASGTRDERPAPGRPGRGWSCAGAGSRPASRW